MSKIRTQTERQLFAISEIPHNTTHMVVERLLPSGDLLITKRHKGKFYKQRYVGYPISMAKKLFTQYVKAEEINIFL